MWPSGCINNSSRSIIRSQENKTASWPFFALSWQRMQTFKCFVLFQVCGCPQALHSLQSILDCCFCTLRPSLGSSALHLQLFQRVVRVTLSLDRLMQSPHRLIHRVACVQTAPLSSQSQAHTDMNNESAGERLILLFYTARHPDSVSLFVWVLKLFWICLWMCSLMFLPSFPLEISWSLITGYNNTERKLRFSRPLL